MKNFFTAARTSQCIGGWLALALIGFSSSIAVAQSALTIDLDGARRIVLKAPAKDVVIGNPSVADVTLVSPTDLIIIGHTPGRTRLLVLDSDQVPLVDQIVIVTQGDSGLVSVFGPRGGAMAQDDYACGYHCTLMPSTRPVSSGGSGKVDNNLSGSESAPPPATGQAAPGNADKQEQPAPETKPSY